MAKHEVETCDVCGNQVSKVQPDGTVSVQGMRLRHAHTYTDPRSGAKRTDLLRFTPRVIMLDHREEGPPRRAEHGVLGNPSMPDIVCSAGCLQAALREWSDAVYRYWTSFLANDGS